MRFAVSTMAAQETPEVVPDSKPLKQDGVITVSIVHTLPALSWVVHSASKLADC